MSGLERIELEPAFVLHARPYRDSSLLLETFSRDHGRLGLIARGARSPRSRVRGLLQPFVPLLLSWRGRGELGTLTGAEAAGNFVPLSGSAAIIGFYLNELLHRFVHRHDPEPALFAHYGATLERIARESDPEPALRIFEKRLLETVGYALELERESDSDTAIDPGARYQVHHGCRPETDDKRFTVRIVRQRIDPARPCSGAAHRPTCAQGGQASHALDHRPRTAAGAALPPGSCGDASEPRSREASDAVTIRRARSVVHRLHARFHRDRPPPWPTPRLLRLRLQGRNGARIRPLVIRMPCLRRFRRGGRGWIGTCRGPVLVLRRCECRRHRIPRRRLLFATVARRHLRLHDPVPSPVSRDSGAFGLAMFGGFGGFTGPVCRVRARCLRRARLA